MHSTNEDPQIIMKPEIGQQNLTLEFEFLGGKNRSQKAFVDNGSGIQDDQKSFIRKNNGANRLGITFFRKI